MLHFGEVVAHADHESYSDVYHVNGRHPQKHVKFNQIPPANTLRSPRTVMIVILDTHITIVAVPGVSGHFQIAFRTFFDILIWRIVKNHPGVAESCQEIGQRLTETDEERDDAEGGVLGGGEDQRYDEVGGDGEGQNGRNET